MSKPMLTAEQRPAVRQDWIDLVFRTVSDGAIMLDQDGLVARINPAAVSMLRCTPQDCLGKKPNDAFRDSPVLAQLLASSLAVTKRVPLPGKRMAIGIAESYDGGRVVVLQDVTEREILDSRREQLINQVAHDLQNPLSAIYGFADLLLNGEDPLTADQQMLLSRVGVAAGKIIQAGPRLFDLAWVESGMPMQNIPVAIERVLMETAEQLEPLMQLKSMMLVTSIQTDMPKVMGDPTRLKQLLYNILHNALQYSEPERMVALHAYHNLRTIHIKVADQGYGMSPEDLEQAFVRMFRSEDEAVRQTPGGGIGLTMAKIIIKRHGGTIEAKSRLGYGSKIMVTLPVVA